MNSFFGSLGNAFLNTQKAAAPMAAQPQMPNLLFQALGAAIRGEDPHVFLQTLAQSHPLLKQYDLSDLQQTAQQVCQEKGVNMQDAVNSIDKIASSIM